MCVSVLWIRRGCGSAAGKFFFFLIEDNRLRISLSRTVKVVCLFLFVRVSALPCVCVWGPYPVLRYPHPSRYTQVEEGDVCACH